MKWSGRAKNIPDFELVYSWLIFWSKKLSFNCSKVVIKNTKFSQNEVTKPRILWDTKFLHKIFNNIVYSMCAKTSYSTKDMRFSHFILALEGLILQTDLQGAGTVGQGVAIIAYYKIWPASMQQNDTKKSFSQKKAVTRFCHYSDVLLLVIIRHD